MTNRAARLLATAVASMLLLSACTNTSPAAAPAPSPTPNPLLQLKSPNTPEQLLTALPTSYGKLRLGRQSGVLLGWPLAPNWLKAHRVEPESCAQSLITGGQTETTFADWPPFPQAVASEDVNSREFEVMIYSLQPPYGDRYLDLLDQRAPHCAKFTIDSLPASIVERPVAGLGTYSRYVVRTYPVQGRIVRRAAILFSTPTYAVHIDARDGMYTEPTLLAFARQVQVLADSKLKG